ncbi:MAG TPA: hypothetical protein DCR90_03790 [Fusobacteriaceae bacterium]|jgi:uncharacterized protein YjbI with pentapeptide repeats|nr:hypothetical protein [Fusobacteriaceae bacterium]
MYYEDMTFTKEDSDLLVFENSEFLNCIFNSCQLISSTFKDTKFINLNFENSELISGDLSQLNQFIIEVGFYNSYLKYCDFSKLNLQKTNFLNSTLKECMFFETNLSQSSFYNSDLEKTSFDRCNLERSNFKNAINYRINPLTNHIVGGKFSLPDLIGLVKDFNIIIE